MDELNPYELAVVEGVRDAAARLSELGMNPESLAWDLNVTVDPDSRAVLGAEGAAATLRALDDLRGPQVPSDETLLKVVRDLHANPWDAGALRQAAESNLSITIGYSNVLDEPDAQRLGTVLDSTVPDEVRGVHHAAENVVRENDRAALHQRIGAVQAPGSAAGPTPAVGPRGARLEAAATTSTKETALAPSKDRAAAPTRPEAAQLRGGERYAGSRTPVPRSQAVRGLER